MQDLKQEIKHTLQNKLHRNAGPEDLVAAEAMLQRIYGKSSSWASCCCLWGLGFRVSINWQTGGPVGPDRV